MKKDLKTNTGGGTGFRSKIGSKLDLAQSNIKTQITFHEFHPTT